MKIKNLTRRITNLPLALAILMNIFYHSKEDYFLFKEL